MILIPGFSGVVLAQSSYDSVYIFGDSLSDSGNVYALTGETSKAPYNVVPSYPYATGGHHFSNGKTWSERLAQAIQDNKGGKPSREAPGQNGNYAHGGARARANSDSAAPASSSQTAMFLQDYGSARPDALYVLQFGGNDLRDALTAGATDPSAVVPIIQSAISALAGNIQTLYFAGARNFLVANAPNIGHAPAVKMMGAGAVASYLVSQYNFGLEITLSQLDALPEVNIRRLDMGGFIDEVVANPESFGLSNVTSPCLFFLAETEARCSNPQEYLFWDGIHPTSAAHKALAERALEALGNN
jgi:outer membrane lipase/esterase